jgi:hypothetical protein
MRGFQPKARLTSYGRNTAVSWLGQTVFLEILILLTVPTLYPCVMPFLGTVP